MIRIIALIFVVFSIVSCQQRQDNIVLTDFTKELISLYIDENIDEYLQEIGESPIIVIATYTDTLNHFLTVRFEAPYFDIWRWGCFATERYFVGRTTYRGFDIRVFGEKESVFHSGAKNIQRIENFGCEEVDGYLPPMWLIVFHKDLSFCKMRTIKGRADEDISDIQRLAERHFKVSNCMPEMHENEVFGFWCVDSPPKLVVGEDSLKRLISSNLKPREDWVHNRFTMWIDIAVDEDGKATVRNLTLQGLVGVPRERTREMWNDARRVAEIITQHEFIPASHRGHIVNSIYSTPFSHRDLVIENWNKK